MLVISNTLWKSSSKQNVYSHIHTYMPWSYNYYRISSKSRRTSKSRRPRNLAAWKSVTTDVIVKSFRTCGITVNVDGSEDNEIHCLKAGEAAHAAASLISDATSKMLDLAGEVESDDEDLFADIDSEDDEELENNEILVDDC